MPGISEQRTALRFGRRKSLGASLALLILVPSLALAGLWGYAADSLVEDALRLRGNRSLAESAAGPADEVLTRIQEERRLTAIWQARPDSSRSRARLRGARDRTDTAAERLREEGLPVLDSAGQRPRKLAGDLSDALDALAQQREAITSRTQSSLDAFDFYTDLADRTLSVFEAASRSDDGRLAHRAAAIITLESGYEFLSREDALLSAALVSGRMASPAYHRFAHFVAAHEHIRTSLVPEDLPAEQAEDYQRVTRSSQWAAVRSIEKDVTESPSGLPGQTSKWRGAAGRVIGELRTVGEESLDEMSGESSSQANGLLGTAVAGSVLAVGAVLLAVVLTRRVHRSLCSRLTGLREETRELAETRLPHLVAQLSRGERVDTTEPAPDHSYGREDEVGLLADALRGMRQAVVATTVQQAKGREGTKKVFLNLARRTQVLIHRQISMLDTLERKHEDPELLEDLFAVDHLATRVRRHAENLVILGGSLPARRWSDAVPVVDVLRSALSETESYTRVKVLPVPRLNLVGQAVADVVHLVAELIENGTSFSPPDTQVSVGAQKVTKGLVLEVEDRGLGLPPEEYKRLNELLAEAPELDMMALGEDPRLGLFVVARLAGRHSVEVSLRKSPYGGTLAIVLLPNALLEEPKSILAGIPGLPIGGRAANQSGDASQQRSGTGGGSLFPFPRVSQREGNRSQDADIRSFPGQRPPFGQRTFPVPGTAGTEEGAHSRPAAEEAEEETSAEVARPRVLPKRVKQSSLVEQLREAADLPAPPKEESENGSEPSPQQSRATMAAIQRETRRARETEATKSAGEEGAEPTPDHDASAPSSAGKEEG